MTAKKLAPRILALAVLSLAPALACAQTEDWKGSGELGLAITTGNTATRNLTAKLSLSREVAQWRHTGSVEVLRAETDGAMTAERYVLAEKSDYKLNRTLYAFGALRRENDKFSSFVHQTSAVVGLGDRFIDDGTTTLDVSAGVGVRTSKVRATGEDDSEPIFRGGALFAYRFNDNVKFGEEVLVESGSDNTYVESSSSLSAKVSASLAAKFVYLVKHNSEVTPGTEKTDTLTTASLVYSF